MSGGFVTRGDERSLRSRRGGGADPLLHQRRLEHGVRAGRGNRRSGRRARVGATAGDRTIVLGVADRSRANHARAHDGQLGLGVRAVDVAVRIGVAGQEGFSAERELLVGHGDHFTGDDLADTSGFTDSDSAGLSPALHRDAHGGCRRCGWQAASARGLLGGRSQASEGHGRKRSERDGDQFQGTVEERVHGDTPW